MGQSKEELKFFQKTTQSSKILTVMGVGIVKGSIGFVVLVMGFAIAIPSSTWSRESEPDNLRNATGQTTRQTTRQTIAPSANRAFDRIPRVARQDNLYQIQPPTWHTVPAANHSTVTPTRSVSPNRVAQGANNTAIDQQSLQALQLFDQNRQLEALLLAMKSGQSLRSIVGNRAVKDYPTYTPLNVLQSILDRIHERNQITINDSTPTQITVSPDGDRFTMSSGDRLAQFSAAGNKTQLWSRTGRLIAELPGSWGKFSPDGQYLLTTEMQNSRTVDNPTAGNATVADLTTRIWNRQGQLVGQLPTVKQAPFASTEFSQNGQQVIQISADRQVVTLWDLKGQKIAELAHPQQQVDQVKISNDGKTIAVTTTATDNISDNIPDNMPLRYASGRTWLWNAAGQQLAILDRIRGVAFHPDNQSLLSVVTNQDGSTTLERLDFSGAVRSTQTLPTNDTYPRSDLRVSPNGEYIAMATRYAEASPSWKWEAWSIAGERVMDLGTESDRGTGLANPNPFSPDGRWIVGLSRNQAGMMEVQLYDMAPPDSGIYTGKVVRRLSDAQYRSPQVYFTPNGQQLVVVDQATGQVQHWQIDRVVWSDIGAGTYVGARAFDKLTEFSVAPSRSIDTGASAQLVVSSASEPSQLHLWDAPLRQLAQFIPQLPGDVAKYYQVNSLQFSADSQRLIVAGEGDRQMVSLEGDRVSGHLSGVLNSFSSDARLSLTKVDRDAKVRLTDLVTGRVIKEVAADYALFSPNGQRWVSVTTKPGANYTASQQIEIWDLNGTRLGELSGPYADRADLVYFAFSDDNQTIAVNGINDGTVKVWRNGQVNTIEVPEFASDVRLSPNGQRLIIHDQNSMRPPALYATNGQMIRQFPSRSIAEFSPDVKAIVVKNSGEFVQDSNVVNGGSVQGTGIELWSAETGQKITDLSPKSRVVQYSANGQKILTFSQGGENLTANDGVMQLWDQSGKKIADMTIDPTVSSQRPVDFDVNITLHEELIIVVNGKTNLISLWNWSGQKVAEFPSGMTNRYEAFRKMAVSPDGQLLAIGGETDNLRIFNRAGQLVKTFPVAPNGQPITAVAFSPDGQSIATGSVNGVTSAWVVNRWTLAGQSIGQWQGDSGRSVRALQFSGDGQKLAIADDENRVRIWQVSSLDQLLERGCEWLQPYFETHPEAKLEACRVGR